MSKPGYREPTPQDLELAYRAGQKAIRDYEREHGQQTLVVFGPPAPGWNFGSGVSGVIE